MTRGLSPAATYQTYPAEKKRRNFKGELSSSSQQIFSAALLSSSSQQPFSAALLSSFSQQPFSAALLSRFSQQLFSAIILLWSGVGGPLVTSSSAALLSYHLAVVRGWWSSMLPFFRRTLSQRFREKKVLFEFVGGNFPNFNAG